MHRALKSFCVAALFLTALTVVSHAQIAGGSGEASGTIGYAHVNGVTSNNHFVLGGAGFYNLNEIVAVGFEYSYTPLGSETNGGVKASGSLQTYGGAGRFSFAKATRTIPYVVAGFGGVSEKAVASAGSLSESASQSGFYFAVGGGASVFCGSNWGIRPEFRYERQHFNSTVIGTSAVGAFSQNDVQAVATVFYQFGGKGH